MSRPSGPEQVNNHGTAEGWSRPGWRTPPSPDARITDRKPSHRWHPNEVAWSRARLTLCPVIPAAEHVLRIAQFADCLSPVRLNIEIAGH